MVEITWWIWIDGRVLSVENGAAYPPPKANTTGRLYGPPHETLAYAAAESSFAAHAEAHRTLLRVRGQGSLSGPLSGERVELLLINQERHERWVNSPAELSTIYTIDEDCDGCRVLG